MQGGELGKLPREDRTAISLNGVEGRSKVAFREIWPKLESSVMRWGEHAFVGSNDTVREKVHNSRIAEEKIQRIIERHIDKHGDEAFVNSFLVLTNRDSQWAGTGKDPGREVRKV